ncbi:hypothetical protein HII31_10108 [Pseudocercospora fuligena]|uniref:DNA replication factor Cdt1 C-terminal domain-containing protein n=1 Tax=Pseudocercospora fuligena TaxID=685502 RepID=A0A8H6R9F6_9PEZI|nr:hypothetical protein HII31_10108 [Pseudocercospora fuligena]
MPKRKASTLDAQPASKQTRSTKTQQSIYTFSSVSKPHAAANEGKKRKTIHTREATPPPAPIARSITKTSKRKREAIAEDSDEEIVVSSKAPEFKAPQQPKVSATPRAKRVKNAAPPTPQETPSKKAAALFDRLNIDSNARAIPLNLPKQKLTYDTPPETPVEEVDIDLSFPRELEDMIDMHAAFLTALSLHYSHNGTASPVELRELLVAVTKHWKKRSVTQADIQRILAFGTSQDRAFILEDCGRAGIRLSRAEPRGRILKRASSYINEDELNTRFENALQKAWHNWQSSTAKENRTAAAFLAQLPLLEITQNEGAARSAPLFAKGEQRLADIKAGRAAKLEPKSATPESSTTTKVPQSLQNRGTALLDRILAKQNAASSLPAGPTKAQLERRAALQRIEDVARILSLMTGTKERSTFSMQVVIQQLQQSLRSPISQVEVWRCLSLMSTEITPGFVKVVQSGEVQGVVVTKSGNVGLSELRARVERACA